MNITITTTPTDRPRANARGTPFKAAANLWHEGWATCCRMISLLGVGVVLVTGTSVASAQVYNWVPWTSTGGQTAEASDPGIGTVTVSASENGTSATTPFPVRFVGVPFAPVNAPSVAVGNTPLQVWTFTIDFTQVPSTSGVILGIGNFGHGTPTLPGYRLVALDTIGNPIPLTALEQIGSYDHVWTDSGIPFNDDVTLNTGSGDFVPTLVAGQNENNTDILLVSLPANVGQLVVSAVGQTSGDTINVLIATTLPIVSDPPDDASACAGSGDATFTVIAGGADPLSYQWRKNTSPISNGPTGSGSIIEGATTLTLAISNVSAADADTYDCVITNPGGNTTSPAATLTVFASGSGDGNGDAFVDGMDISAFMAALLQGSSPSQSYCACDMNADGLVDLTDVDPFVSSLVGP
jgi:hypothetical protein